MTELTGVMVIILIFSTICGFVAILHNLTSIHISLVKIQNLLERIEMIEKTKVK